MMKTVLELSLECGHKIQTLHLTKSEKETQTTVCPLEQLIKPTRIIAVRRVVCKPERTWEEILEALGE